jgi:hypothetical protein
MSLRCAACTWCRLQMFPWIYALYCRDVYFTRSPVRPIHNLGSRGKRMVSLTLGPLYAWRRRPCSHWKVGGILGLYQVDVKERNLGHDWGSVCNEALWNIVCEYWCNIWRDELCVKSQRASRCRRLQFPTCVCYAWWFKRSLPHLWVQWLSEF